MSDTRPRRLGLIAFILLCSAGSLSAVWQASHWGDGLSRVDPFSESNVVREVRHFLEDGFWRNAGLGTVYYPGLYSDQGFESRPHNEPGVTPDGVYTHYPPGPEWLAYAAAVVLGPTPLWHLRMLPAALTLAATIWFGLQIRRRFGPAVGWIVMAACALTPSFSDAATSLHDHGYEFALLLVEIGLCLDRRPRMLPFLALGFVQGWLSFDYVFLVTFTPLAIVVALARLEHDEGGWPAHNAGLSLGVRRCLLAGAGFTIAHLLHFAQVCVFFGSVHATIADLAEAAAHRSGAEADKGVLDHVLNMVALAAYYVVTPVPIRTFFWHPYSESPTSWQGFRFLGMSLGVWWIVVLACLPLRNAWAARIGAPADRTLLKDWLWVSAAGVMPSLMWPLVMLNHGQVHVHFLYRHLFLAFFLWLLFASIAVVKRRPVAAAQRAEAKLAEAVPQAS
jgi:hypothetical protein